jgi:ribonuclease VapC
VIVDTSAIMAILGKEPEDLAFRQALAGTANNAMSSATLLELQIVAQDRAGSAIEAEVTELLAQAGIEIGPFTAQHAALAIDGWRRYGRGRHPAGLNFGDCIAYALARSRDEPLLFKGDDFAQTDVKAAI